MEPDVLGAGRTVSASRIKRTMRSRRSPVALARIRGRASGLGIVASAHDSAARRTGSHDAERGRSSGSSVANSWTCSAASSFFTTGDAFKLAARRAVIVDAKTGKTTCPYVPDPHVCARQRSTRAARSSSLWLSDQTSSWRKPPTTIRAQIRGRRATSPVPNPELDPEPAAPSPARKGGRVGRISLTGKVVEVRFVVRVPPATKLSDNVYLSTDVSGWNAQAIQMNRIDGLHYAVTLPLRTGTEFAYKYTRGSWRLVRTRTDGDRRRHRASSS